MSVGRALVSCSWMLALCVGCIARQPPTPPTVAKAEVGAQSAGPTPPVVALEHAPLRVELRGPFVRIAGEDVTNQPLEVRGALSRARGSATTLIATASESPQPVHVDKLIEAALGTELEKLVLELAGERFELALQPSSKPTHEVSVTSEGRLRLQALREGGNGYKQLEWSLNAPTPVAMGKLCDGPCLIQVSYEPGGPPLFELLRSVQEVLSNEDEVQLYARPFNVAPDAPRVRVGAQAVSGRLPPEVIQRVVRQNFGVFRKCYEQGLARNPDLQGKVQARFVIGRDGHVSQVSDGGSDLPDPAVRDCVLEGFKLIVFPEPEGGIVTVVYPILLAPG